MVWSIDILFSTSQKQSQDDLGRIQTLLMQRRAMSTFNRESMTAANRRWQRRLKRLSRRSYSIHPEEWVFAFDRGAGQRRARRRSRLVQAGTNRSRDVFWVVNLATWIKNGRKGASGKDRQSVGSRGGGNDSVCRIECECSVSMLRLL